METKARMASQATNGDKRVVARREYPQHRFACKWRKPHSAQVVSGEWKRLSGIWRAFCPQLSVMQVGQRRIRRIKMFALTRPDTQRWWKWNSIHRRSVTTNFWMSSGRTTIPLLGTGKVPMLERNIAR